MMIFKAKKWSLRLSCKEAAVANPRAMPGIFPKHKGKRWVNTRFLHHGKAARSEGWVPFCPPPFCWRNGKSEFRGQIFLSYHWPLISDNSQKNTQDLCLAHSTYPLWPSHPLPYSSFSASNMPSSSKSLSPTFSVWNVFLTLFMWSSTFSPFRTPF